MLVNFISYPSLVFPTLQPTMGVLGHDGDLGRSDRGIGGTENLVSGGLDQQVEGAFAMAVSLGMGRLDCSSRSRREMKRRVVQLGERRGRPES